MTLDPETLVQHHALLAIHRRNLAVYLRQQAELGVLTPPAVVNGIAEATAQIGQIKAALRASGVAVDDLPDDSTQPVAPSTRLSDSERRNRQRMLQKVRMFWVEGVLERSLYDATRLALGMQAQPDAVANPWDAIVQPATERADPIPPETQIAAVFDQHGGELLILGMPGAGKTTLLLDLARVLLDRAEQQETHPLPVVFNLASWAERRAPLEAWLVDELNMRYDVPQAVGRAWLDTDAILPLLDGLDEVWHEQRTACVAAINTFRHSHGMVGLVICCRADDYRALGEKVKLAGAVLVHPLTQQQVDAALLGAGGHLAILRAILTEDAALRELAQTPLLLSIMILAYRDTTTAAMPSTGTIDERRAHVFATYIDRMFQRRGVQAPYTQQQALGWLGWLARSLAQRARTIFFIERMQPQALLTPTQRRHYAMLVGIMVACVYGLAVGLAATVAYTFLAGAALGRTLGPFYGLVFGAVFGISSALAVNESDAAATASPWRYIPRSLGIGLAFGLMTAVFVWLVLKAELPIITGRVFTGLIAGLASGLILGLVAHPHQIESVETLRWSWTKARHGVGRTLLAGLVIGLAAVLTSVLNANPAALLANGIAVAMITVLVVGLTSGLATGEVEAKTRPNQGMWRSAANAARLGAITTLVGGPAAGLAIAAVGTLGTVLLMNQSSGTMAVIIGPLYGLMAGVLVATLYGGLTVIQHLALRLILWQSGVMPLRYSRFLDYAAERNFLRKIGGGYIFVHRLLLEYIAALPSDSRERQA